VINLNLAVSNQQDPEINGPLTFDHWELKRKRKKGAQKHGGFLSFLLVKDIKLN